MTETPILEIVPPEDLEGRTLKLVHIKEGKLTLIFNGNYKLEVETEATIQINRNDTLQLKKTLDIRAFKPKPDPSSTLDIFHG